ncbi:endonuclease VII domain-containing protein [Bosea sp. (in: a-proteobacteria)]|uniref:endonuclease VII domain-containing protein n=1 Tax=Bosea sp. (in: a-proteobacteria) TaxID=1871050 RepID=UPI0026042F62|nr:endonuclease VII domain-containing protein [Bosea sp. (in: a-proteobacteria)]MCO5092095.1 endonuclease VII domain-containing protein [Bosea sp. (in: a-proteobacteria)]
MKTCGKCGFQKPLSEFWTDRRRGKPKSKCKTCSTADTKHWRTSNPGYETRRYQAAKAETRERHLKRKYGVSLADYDRLLASQGGACAICAAPEAEQFKGVFHVDHCHSTGSVRGLLCRGCNHMLGAIKDDPKKLLIAVRYLVGPQVAAEVIGAFLDVEGSVP